MARPIRVEYANAVYHRMARGNKRMTVVAADYGYRDGSGMHRVLQRVEAKARAN